MFCNLYIGVLQVKYYRCACRMEVLSIEEVDDEIYISIYHMGRAGLWNILRHCWKILRTGRPYGDQVVLAHPDAQDMGETLLKLTQEMSDRDAKQNSSEIKDNLDGTRGMA